MVLPVQLVPQDKEALLDFQARGESVVCQDFQDLGFVILWLSFYCNVYCRSTVAKTHRSMKYFVIKLSFCRVHQESRELRDHLETKALEVQLVLQVLLDPEEILVLR